MKSCDVQNVTRVRKKEHLAAENVNLRQSPRLLVKLPTGAAKNNFALCSADGGDCGQQFSQLGESLRSFKTFPYNESARKSQSEMLPSVFPAPLSDTFFAPKKRHHARPGFRFCAITRVSQTSLASRSLTSTSSEPLIPFLFGSSPLLLKFLARPACPLFPSDS